MLLVILSMMLGFVLLMCGARILCDSVIRLAYRFNVSSVAAGVLLVSIGTAAPDLTSVVTATLKGYSDFSVGNILGSNFSNLTLGFGIAALVSPFRCAKRILSVDLPLLFVITVFFVICCIDGNLTRVDGILFLSIFACYSFFSLRKTKPRFAIGRVEFGENVANCAAWKNCMAFVAATILLACGSHLVVMSCVGIADNFGLSQTFVGFSLSSLGTSAPEIFVVATAAKRRYHTICSGNVFGSNLINLMFVAGLCATIHPICFHENDFYQEACALILVTAASWYIFWTRKVFSRALGAALVATYLAVIFLVKN